VEPAPLVGDSRSMNEERTNMRDGREMTAKRMTVARLSRHSPGFEQGPRHFIANVLTLKARCGDFNFW
jgi:hypothetical protein